MKVGRLITDDGIEFSLESSQLRELTEYLCRQEANDAIAAQASATGLPCLPSLLDPEDYERAAQAAYFVRQVKALPAAA